MEWTFIAAVPTVIVCFGVAISYLYSWNKINLSSLRMWSGQYHYARWSFAAVLVPAVIWGGAICISSAFPSTGAWGLLMHLCTVPLALAILATGLLQPVWRPRHGTMRHLPALMISAVVLGVLTSPFFLFFWTAPFFFVIAYLVLFGLSFVNSSKNTLQL